MPAPSEPPCPISTARRRSMPCALVVQDGVVYVPHPIQNRTKAEIETIADQAFDKVMALLKA